MNIGSYIATKVKTNPKPNTTAELYIDLMKRSLTRVLFAKEYERQTILPCTRWLRTLAVLIRSILTPLNLELVRRIHTGPKDYLESGDAAKNRVEDAETMLGIHQLDQMQACINDVIDRNIPGDLLEAGVWRGGMTIFMRAVLKTHNENNRRVWVVDSFSGLPNPDKSLDSFWWKMGEMAVSLEEVKSNFDRYGLLDEQVVFLKGFFNDTLPEAPISKLSVLRIDADLYSSTIDALNNLYPKLSIGGYAIFDDYQNLPECRKAIDEFRQNYNINDPIVKIDQRAIYWIKTSFFSL